MTTVDMLDMLGTSTAFAEFEVLASQAELDFQQAELDFQQPPLSIQLTASLPDTHLDHTSRIKSRATQKTALFIQQRLKEYPEQFPPYAIIKRRGGLKQVRAQARPVQVRPAQKIKIKPAALAKVRLFVSSTLKQEFYLHDSFPAYAICKPPPTLAKKRKRENTKSGCKKLARTSVLKAPRNTNFLSEKYASMIQRRATFNEFSKVQGTDQLFRQAMHALRYEIETKQAYTMSSSSTGLGRAQSYFQMMLDALCVNQNDGLRRLTRQDMLEIVENAAEIVSERKKNDADGLYI
jgi:hypothetical protein